MNNAPTMPPDEGGFDDDLFDDRDDINEDTYDYAYFDETDDE